MMTYMTFQILLLMSILYGITTYFHGHQGSHLTHNHFGDAPLNPFLVLILNIYIRLFFPWLILLYIGYKTHWSYPVIILVISQVIRLILISIQRKLDWNGALISLTGILVIPITSILLIVLTFNFLIN